jgi:hypothetical protein
MPRPTDKALFLAGESTLTAAEVAQWASDLGYPLEVAEADAGEQLEIVKARDAAADDVPRWRSK